MVTQLLTCEKCGNQYPAAWAEDACPHHPVNEMRLRALEMVRADVEIPDGLAEWMVRVLEAEGLGDHRVSVWLCSAEGEYDQYDHEIRIGLCPRSGGEYDETETKNLFLHEVGHGVVHLAGLSFEDSYWHREAWEDAYAGLLARHGEAVK